MQASRTALIVIDPQRAFVDPAGSVARTFGVADTQPGLEALARLRIALAGRHDAAPTIFVRSDYRPGQFTGGDLSQGMAYVCVPGRGIDCEWAAGISVPPHAVIITKHQADAAGTDDFRAAIEDALARGVTRLAITGFQFTTCVMASALSMLDLVRARGVRVAVVEPLTGSRASSHVPGPSGLSRVDATRWQLEAAGVDLLQTLDDWT
jgi:nicotinamidase-related amidase